MMVHLEGRGGRLQVQGQSGLHRETLSQKQQQQQNKISWAPVAHTCNLRDRRQRSGGQQLKPALGKLSIRPYLEKHTSQKSTGGAAQGVGPDFKPQYHEKKI
jgi:hypothetical protein